MQQTPHVLLLTLEGAASAARSGIPISGVRVRLSPECDRRRHATDTRITTRWEEKVEAATKSGRRLFDQSKFRLERIDWTDSTRQAVTIELGLTSYKEHIGTNALPTEEREELEAGGLAQHGRRYAHMANALGVETVLITSDGFVVLLRRSGAVEAGTGQYNGPSGHAEPSHAGIEAHVQRSGWVGW